MTQKQNNGIAYRHGGSKKNNGEIVKRQNAKTPSYKEIEMQMKKDMLMYGMFGNKATNGFQYIVHGHGNGHGHSTRTRIRHNGTTAQRHNGTTAQRHNGTTAQRHNGTTAQQHNSTTAQQHNSTTAQQN